jgi:MFS family permease
LTELATKIGSPRGEKSQLAGYPDANGRSERQRLRERCEMATTHTTTQPSTDSVRSLIPARIDRLTWSRFHTRLIVALGVAWILDGLEVTIASAIGPLLGNKETLHLSSGAIGDIATWYLIGEVAGALLFGHLSDKLGRRNLFTVTLGVYFIGSALTAATVGSATRVIAGMGIGGEYAAINSAIDELIPAHYRGRVDIGVNGTYWAGSILGTLLSLVLLNHVANTNTAWRLAFLLGPVLALVIIFVRKNLPESPRWLLMHGREAEAEESLQRIETLTRESGGELRPVDENKSIEVKPSRDIGFLALARVLFTEYPSRSVLGATLMITQSFLYNAIFFTYTLVIVKIYGVNEKSAPWYLVAFAVGNLVGPLTIGRLFDTIGRRAMIAGTYLVSGTLLAVSAELFREGHLSALTQTIWWCVIFFFASAGASAAYLTVSEIFPLEVRAKAIAVFFAIAQCFGAAGPHIYGHLIGNGHDHFKLFVGYLIGAGVMIVGGIVELFLGVKAERQSLEDIATPLSAVRRIPEFGSGYGAPRRTG